MLDVDSLDICGWIHLLLDIYLAMVSLNCKFLFRLHNTAGYIVLCVSIFMGLLCWPLFTRDLCINTEMTC